MKPKRPPPTKSSALSRSVIDALKGLFPNFVVKTELPIKTASGETLFVDVVVEKLKLAIECHGRQHFEYIPFFHRSERDLEQQRDNDREKAASLKKEGWNLIVVRYDDPVDTHWLSKRIVEYYKSIRPTVASGRGKRGDRGGGRNNAARSGSDSDRTGRTNGQRSGGDHQGDLRPPADTPQ